MKVLQYPLAKITMGFLSGILIAFYWQADIYLIFGTLLLLLMVASILFFGTRNIKKSKFFFSLLTYAISFLTGMSSLIIQTEAFRKDNYSNLKSVFEKESKINLTAIIWQKKSSTRLLKTLAFLINMPELPKPDLTVRDWFLQPLINSTLNFPEVHMNRQKLAPT